MDHNRTETFRALLRLLNPDEGADGFDITCPNCGKEPAHGQIHAHFSEGKGFFCQVCKEGGSLERLLKLVGGEQDKSDYTPYRPTRNRLGPKPAPERERPWRDQAIELISLYRKPPDLVRRWQAYKPLSDEAITRYRLGFGRLPGQQTERLIVPIFHHDQVVALHGRDPRREVTERKWICATGSSKMAYGLDELEKGCDFWVCENFVDRIMFRERFNGIFDCIALGGVRLFYAEEIEAIKAVRPKRIFIALDNDLVGQPNQRQKPEMLRKWFAEHPDAKKEPESFGPRIANQLQQMKLPAVLFRWPNNAPHKAGVDWAMDHLDE